MKNKEEEEKKKMKKSGRRKRLQRKRRRMSRKTKEAEETGLMPFESSGTILHVAKISYQSDDWFGNC